MQSLARRSRTNFSFGSFFTRHYSAAAGVDARQEAAKWKKYAFGALAFVALSHVAILSMGHDHEERHQYAHMFLVNKNFPWGNGKTPFFGLRGSEHAEEH